MSASAAHLSTAGPLDAIARLTALVAEDMRAVDALFAERLASQADVIPEIGAHIIDAGGKRLRPILTLASAAMFGGAGARAQKLAAAVEFIHTATLLHDDVVDESAKRRAKPTANVIWGNQSSVLVGDFLFSRAFELMVETGDLAILDLLAKTASRIAEGEVLQLSIQRKIETDEGTYRRVIGAKTAALFSAAAEAGGMAAGCGAEARAALKIYGERLGVAFQLVDDALDYQGREAALGKSVGDDFKEGKITLPVILAYARGDEGDKAFWRRTIAEGDYREGDLPLALNKIAGAQAAADTMLAARAAIHDAIDALGVLPSGPHRTALADAAAFTVERER